MTNLKETEPEYYEIFGDAWRLMCEMFPVGSTSDYWVASAQAMKKYSDKWRGNDLAVSLIFSVWQEAVRVSKERRSNE